MPNPPQGPHKLHSDSRGWVRFTRFTVRPAAAKAENHKLARRARELCGTDEATDDLIALNYCFLRGLITVDEYCEKVGKNEEELWYNN